MKKLSICLLLSTLSFVFYIFPAFAYLEPSYSAARSDYHIGIIPRPTNPALVKIMSDVWMINKADKSCGNCGAFFFRTYKVARKAVPRERPLLPESLVQYIAGPDINFRFPVPGYIYEGSSRPKNINVRFLSNRDKLSDSLAEAFGVYFKSSEATAALKLIMQKGAVSQRNVLLLVGNVIYSIDPKVFRGTSGIMPYINYWAFYDLENSEIIYMGNGICRP